MLYLTSDPHFGHGNILRYCQRPMLKPEDLDYKGNWLNKAIEKQRTQEMDTIIIRNINERVKPEDTLYILGDFCFKYSSEASEAPKKAFEYYRELLQCKNIIFILGNHDHHNAVKGFLVSCQIAHGGKIINMVHNPMHSNPDYEINLVGHVHNNWKIRTFKLHYNIIERLYEQTTDNNGRSAMLDFLAKNNSQRNSESILVNVGVDVWNFRPINYSEIIGAVIKFKKALTSNNQNDTLAA